MAPRRLTLKAFARNRQAVKWLAYPLTHTHQFDILRCALLTSEEIGCNSIS
jgi:hypothetical protein